MAKKTTPALPEFVLIENKQVYGEAKLVIYTKAPYFVCQMVCFSNQESQDDFLKKHELYAFAKLKGVRIILLLSGCMGEPVIDNDADAVALYISQIMAKMRDWYQEYLKDTEPEKLEKYREE